MEPEFVDGPDARWNDAHHPDRATLLEDVAAESAEPGDAVGQIDLLRAPEFLVMLRMKSTLAIASVSLRSSRFSSEATTRLPLTRIIG